MITHFHVATFKSISVNLAGEAAENTFVAVGFSDDRFIVKKFLVSILKFFSLYHF